MEGGGRQRYGDLPAHRHRQHVSALFTGVADRSQHRHHADGGRLWRGGLAQSLRAAALSQDEDCLSESGIGWIPYLMERADYSHEQHHVWTHSNQYFGERSRARSSGAISICFIDDAYGLRNLDLIGEDNVCYEVDYPHSDAPWPQRAGDSVEVGATSDGCADRQDHASERHAALQVRPIHASQARGTDRGRAARQGARPTASIPR